MIGAVPPAFNEKEVHMRVFFALAILGCLAGFTVVAITLADYLSSTRFRSMDPGEWFVLAACCAVFPYCLARSVQILEESDSRST